MPKSLSETMLATYRAQLQDRLADPARLERVFGSRLLEPALQDKLRAVCRTAQRSLRVEAAFITLIGKDRLMWVAIHGEVEGEPPLTDQSFCQHHIMGDGLPYEVVDAREEQLMCDLSSVTEAGMLAYLGVPLIEPEGHVIGSLCVVDSRPREWRAADSFLLSSLAGTAMDLAYGNASGVR